METWIEPETVEQCEQFIAGCLAQAEDARLEARELKWELHHLEARARGLEVRAGQLRRLLRAEVLPR